MERPASPIGEPPDGRPLTDWTWAARPRRVNPYLAEYRCRMGWLASCAAGGMLAAMLNGLLA